MSVQSSRGEPHERAHPPGRHAQGSEVAMVKDSARKGPTERTFVVQFDPVEDARSRLRGRVELVASGEGIRFRSLKQLVGFLASQLRTRAKGERR
jgi:hypothetical protein